MSGELNVQRNIVYVTGSGYQTTSDLAASTVLTAGTSHVLGSWAELVRAPQDLWIVGTFLSFNVLPVVDVSYFEVELGIGESGQENTIWQAKTHAVDWNASDAINLYRMSWWRRYIRVQGSQRISGRLASDLNGTSIQLALAYVNDNDLKVMK